MMKEQLYDDMRRHLKDPYVHVAMRIPINDNEYSVFIFDKSVTGPS